MKLLSRIIAVTLLGAGVSQAQIDMPNPAAPGGSFETAVRLVVGSDLMLESRIRRWLRTHYPGWDADSPDMQDMGDSHYAVVYLTHKDHPARRVYFRVFRTHADPEAGPDLPF